MKILVSAQAPDIGAPIDPRFGRAPHFVVVDVESGDWTAYENGSMMAGHGAGIEAARFVVDLGVQAVITGAAGPNAFRTLQAAEIPVYVVGGGTVADAVGAFRQGGLSRANDASVPAHSGMGRGAGMRTGGGQGRGMGGGKGRGTGGGKGRGGGKRGGL